MICSSSTDGRLRRGCRSYTVFDDLCGSGRPAAIVIALLLCCLFLTHDAHADHNHFVTEADSSHPLEAGDGPLWEVIHGLEHVLDSGSGSPATAAELARRYLAIFRYEGDNRLLLRAEEVLSPWSGELDPPVAVALERAVLWQTQHRFFKSIDGLERLVRRAPRNTRAWLTLASVATEIGDYSRSRTACGQLLWLADPVIGGTCFAAANAVGGEAEEAAALMVRMFARRAADDDLMVETWMRSVAAQAALALGRPVQAESNYRAALAAAERAGQPHEIYLLIEYADFLLGQARAGEAIALLRDAPRADPIRQREARARQELTF